MNKYKLNGSYHILLSCLILLFTQTGCSIIGGIFKAGVEVGIFLIVVLIIVILILINRFKKRY